MDVEFRYLVVLSHSLDDIPMGLFADRDEANQFASQLNWDVPDDLLQRLDLPGCNTPCMIAITTFAGSTPVSRDIVRNYEDEDEALAEKLASVPSITPSPTTN